MCEQFPEFVAASDADELDENFVARVQFDMGQVTVIADNVRRTNALKKMVAAAPMMAQEFEKQVAVFTMCIENLTKLPPHPVLNTMLDAMCTQVEDMRAIVKNIQSAKIETSD